MPYRAKKIPTPSRVLGTRGRRRRIGLAAGILAFGLAAGPLEAKAELVRVYCWLGPKPIAYLDIRADSDAGTVELQSYPDVKSVWVLFANGAKATTLCPEPDHCHLLSEPDNVQDVARIQRDANVIIRNSVPPGTDWSFVQHTELTAATIKFGFTALLNRQSADTEINIDVGVDRSTFAIAIQRPTFSSRSGETPAGWDNISNQAMDGLKAVNATLARVSCGLSPPILYSVTQESRVQQNQAGVAGGHK